MASIGLDEANFLHPVIIGDHIKVTAGVVHACATSGIFRVSHHPTRHEALGSRLRTVLRSNFLRFLYASEPDHLDAVLPETYEEILGAHRHAEEPITDATRKHLDAFLAGRPARH